MRGFEEKEEDEDEEETAVVGGLDFSLSSSSCSSLTICWRRAMRRADLRKPASGGRLVLCLMHRETSLDRGRQTCVHNYVYKKEKEKEDLVNNSVYS